MKQLVIGVMLVSIAWGCGSSESSNYVQTEIPTELSGNTDVQEYFENIDNTNDIKGSYIIILKVIHEKLFSICLVG